MQKILFLKFIYLSLSNIKKFILINVLLVIPTLVFFYSFFHLIPVAAQYLNSFDVVVKNVNPEYEKLSIVLVSKRSGRETPMDEEVYIFKGDDFNRMRKSIFLSMIDDKYTKEMKEKALGYREIPIFGKKFDIKDNSGNRIASLKIENVREGSVEIIFYNSSFLPEKSKALLYIIMIILSFIVVSGSLGGICNFIQRVVFHETRHFKYLFIFIARYFLRSFSVSLFMFIVILAIISNIYFYIFVISNDISVFIAALNVWMLIFFLFVLLWVYPLLILNNNESLWRIMKKSLFVSFDNFKFSIEVFAWLILMFIFSFFTLFIFPGIAFIFSFLNTSLKEISFRYSKSDIS